MVKFDNSINTVLLSEANSAEFRKLFYSFQAAGVKVIPIVLEDDGFLPDGFVSVTEYFLENGFADLKDCKPCYFNEISIPKFWEISANNSFGTITDLNKERGKIYYSEPLHLRNVRVVDWFDENGKVRICEHYNAKGKIFARTYFNAKEEKVSKVFNDSNGKECVYINYVTGDYTITKEDGTNKIFYSQMDFVKYFFAESGLEDKKVYFNSLSYPFFASQVLNPVHKEDVLFWNEPIKNSIPGNMQMILNGTANRCSKIYVSRSDAYENLMKLGADSSIVEKLGYVYPFAKENNGSYQALICTNSDQIESLNKLVEELPMVHFHICALTEMSSKLLSVSSYDNVNTYPGVKQSVLSELYKKCDFYFDINYGNEIVNSVYQAFLYNHLIFSFESTNHQSNYVALINKYKSSDVHQMIQDIQNCILDTNIRNERLKAQHEHALSEDRLTFAKCFSH